MEIGNQNNILMQKNPAYCRETSSCSNPVFKSKLDDVLRKSGNVMNWIEDGGFLVLFIIQDFFGMTVPRTVAGFLRDKEVTGEYNIQEGFEVLGREGLTGPSMMAVAPLSLWLCSKMLGKSTSVNTELIKRYGNSLKEMVSEPDFNDALLKDSAKFKNEFYKKNIRAILDLTLENTKSNSIPKAELDKSVEYIIKQLENYENIPKDAKLKKFMGKSKYRTECLSNIALHINDLKFSTSEDLDMLQKVKFGSSDLKDYKIFDTKKAFEGLVKYSDDTIIANKKLEKLNSVMAEGLKHSALGKRVLVNIGMVAATLGMLSYLPKIYARGEKAPGARKNTQENTPASKNVSFKGKNTSIIEKLGQIAEKNKKDFVSSELEYNGHNFTNTLMACLSVFGLITPRCLRAYKRADVDDKGKKDLTELWEIIIRDITSSLSVVFAVPMLTRAFVTAYEKQSGFVLMQKDRTKTGFKTALDLLNPYSKAHVLSNAEITALYDNINTKEKMLNFCRYVDKNGGDLQKIISKSEGVSELFSENAELFNKSKNLSRADANKKIIDFVENIEERVKNSGKSADKKSIDNLITKLMKCASKGKNSKITTFARGLNSVPGLVATIFISPYILGWFIPRLTYKNTRRIHKKEDNAKKLQEQHLQTSV